jgi:hypothetical protein
MAGGTPDWSALASENERFLADGGASGERLVPRALWQASAEQVAGAAHAAAAGSLRVHPAGPTGSRPAAGAPGTRRPRWRIRGATAGAGAALAVTAIAAVGASGGRAFSEAGPALWR